MFGHISLTYNLLMNLNLSSVPDRTLRSVPFVFLGVGFARAWLALLFANPVVAVPSIGVSSHMMFDCAYVLMALAAVVWTRRIVPLGAHGALAATAFGLMLLSTLLAAGASGDGLEVLGLVAAVAGGLGFLLFSLLNVEACASLSTLRLVLCLSAAYFLGGFLAFLGNGLAPFQLQVLLVVLPLIACACVHAAFQTIPPTALPHRLFPRFSYPWKLYVLMALYSFAYGLRQMQMVVGAGRGSTYATMLVSAMVFIVAWFFANRVVLIKASRASMLFMICGFLLVPAQSAMGDFVSSYLISISYTLMHVFMLVLLCSMARKSGVPAPVLVAPLYARQLFTIAGVGVDEGLGALGLSAVMQSTVSVVLVSVLVALITLLLLSERRWDAYWTVSLDDGSLEEASRREEMCSAHCDELAARCGLSPRENEIMRLLAHKKTMAAIAHDLFIAEGTVKAHVRHIYKKVGINSRKELYDLLGIE